MKKLQYLQDYSIDIMNDWEINTYINLLIHSFNIDNEDVCLYENLYHNYVKKYFFVTAKLFSDKSVIGGICFESKPIFQNYIYIDNLFVDKKYQKMGIATNLINYIVLNKQKLFDSNDINLYLFCEKELKTFYKKKEFNITGEYNDTIVKTLRMDRKI